MSEARWIGLSLLGEGYGNAALHPGIEIWSEYTEYSTRLRLCLRGVFANRARNDLYGHSFRPLLLFGLHSLPCCCFSSPSSRMATGLFPPHLSTDILPSTCEGSGLGVRSEEIPDDVISGYTGCGIESRIEG